jgi:hypothetical protein
MRCVHRTYRLLRNSAKSLKPRKKNRRANLRRNAPPIQTVEYLAVFAACPVSRFTRFAAPRKPGLAPPYNQERMNPNGFQFNCINVVNMPLRPSKPHPRVSRR